VRALRDYYHRFLAGLGLLAGVSLGLIALTVTLDVGLRNLGWGNLPWLIEVAEYTLFVSTFLAAPWVLSLGAHVRVDVLVSALPRDAAVAVDFLVDGIGLAIALVLLYFGFSAAADAHRIGSLIFKELVVPEWWLLSAIPVSAALLAIEFVFRIADRGGSPPDPMADVVQDGL